MNLDRIIQASDAVMVARGDLGVEVGYAELTGLQKHIISATRKRNRVVDHRDADDGIDDPQPDADARRSVATSPTRSWTAPTR